MNIVDGKYAYTINRLTIRNLLKQKFLVFDFEATGPDVKSDHVTQIGCVPLVNNKIIREEAFSSYIKSPKPIPTYIEDIVGITNEQIKNAHSFTDVIQALWKRYRDYIWIGQSSMEFDFQLLRAMCKKYRISINPKKMDIKILFAYLHPDLDDVTTTNFFIRHYKIDTTGLRRHDALHDSLLLARITQKILAVYKKKGIKDMTINKPLAIKKSLLVPVS